MESRSRIGSVLIICGTVCIVAALTLVAVFGYLLSYAPVPAGRTAAPIEFQSGFFVTVTWLCGLAGFAFVVVGVVVGLRQSSQTNKTPSSPP